MRYAIISLLAVVLMAGCGADSKPSADQALVAEVAQRYLDAFAKHDWTAVCQTRAPKERAYFAKTGGSCEAVFKLLLEKQPGLDEILAKATVGDVRIEGGHLAGADVVQPDEAKPATTLAAVKLGSRWFLQDISDAKTP